MPQNEFPKLVPHPFRKRREASLSMPPAPAGGFAELCVTSNYTFLCGAHQPEELVRQRPGTASGVVFITLEDETGVANLILWSNTFEKHRKAARLSKALLVRGRVQREGDVVHVHARGLRSIDSWMDEMIVRSRDFH
jgi:DNA polymerase III alpha subunit